ncbi:MAG: carboxypeptidase-like regulatory domain-containing protein, partial [Selenomonas sp.]|nr:carboxypeptidase-like regulatory domain-containing protein [Selenomonas sp.]
MKQILFSINTVKELHNCIEQVREESRSLHTASVLVSVFMDASKKEMLDDIRKAVQAVFPEAQLVGAVSSGEIVNGNLMDKGVVVNFTLYEKSQVRVLAYDFRESDSQKAGADLLAVLQADKDVAAVELISAGFHLDINPFLHKLSASRKKIVFFGGLADDGSLGQNGMVFTQGQSVRHGVVAVVFSGSSLHVKAVSSFGWKPLGRTMTVTGMDGDYTISVPSGTANLVVSFIGYADQVIPVAGRSQIDVQMQDDAAFLDEVVVVGYATVKRRDLLGSVSSVGSDKLAEQPVTTVSQALSGKMAGVSVVTTEGDPDADIKIRVRGGGSITQDSSP